MAIPRGGTLPVPVQHQHRCRHRRRRTPCRGTLQPPWDRNETVHRCWKAAGSRGEGGRYEAIRVWQNIGTNGNYWPRQNSRADKILASTKILHRQNSRADKNLASTKISLRQKSRIYKMLVQTQKDPLPVWLGRVHSCRLLPDLAEDLLCLPDGVDAFASSYQLWRCFWPPCFYGWTLSRTVTAYCTGPPCRKRHKFWPRRNIGVRLKFTDFHQTIAVCISAHRRPIKSGENKKWSPSLSTISLYTHILKFEDVLEIHSWGLRLLKWGVGGRGGRLTVPPVMITIAAGGWGRTRKIGERWGGGGGLCTPDNSIHKSRIPLSLPFSLPAFCLFFFPLSRPGAR